MGRRVTAPGFGCPSPAQPNREANCQFGIAGLASRSALGHGRVMSQKPIFCVGAFTCDLVLHVPDLPAGAGKFLASRATMVAAGMATSAATAIARLGWPVALWASAGDDMVGDFIVGEIARDGIDTTLIRRLPGVMSATASIIVDARGERSVVPFYDPVLLSEPETTPTIDETSFAAVLVDVRWPAAAARALDQARKAGLAAILDLDVGPQETLAELAGRATHIVASLAGGRILTGKQGVGDVAAALSTAFDATVAVTDGENGVVWRTPGSAENRFTPAFPVQAVDTNAAGDIFHGAFAVAVAEDMPLDKAIRFASAAAAIKCTRYGGRSGAPMRAEVNSFLAEKSANEPEMQGFRAPQDS